MIKTHIHDKFLTKWFTKSLLQPISWDVDMVGETTKEQDILCAQHLDLIYSHSDTLYDIITNYPLPSTDPFQPHPGPHADGVVSFIPHAHVNHLFDQLGQLYIQSQPSTVGTSSQTDTIPAEKSKVNPMQSIKPNNPQQIGGKKKQNKKKKLSNEKRTSTTQTS
jgi:hypothetical protein